MMAREGEGEGAPGAQGGEGALVSCAPDEAKEKNNNIQLPLPVMSGQRVLTLICAALLSAVPPGAGAGAGAGPQAGVQNLLAEHFFPKNKLHPLLDTYMREQLIFLGNFSLMDPAREEVPAAIADCHTAGIQVIMVRRLPSAPPSAPT